MGVTRKKYHYLVKTGRPTKYIPELIYPKIEEYLESCSREQTELPTVEGLALRIGVIPETLIEWEKKYPEFSVSIKNILARQKVQLMNDGMYGGKEVNQAMAIFLLKVNHGMKDNLPQVMQQFNVGSKDSDKNMIVFVNFKNGTEG